MGVLTQIRILAKLELCNIFGLNVLRFSRDGKVKRRAGAMLALVAVLSVLLVFYMGGLSYGLVRLGLEAVIPVYLIAVASLIIFFFGLLKAGSVIYRRDGYESLCSLPLSQTAVIWGRFVRMYVENLLFTLAALLPGLGVYAWAVRPGLLFYFAALTAIGAVPFLPMAGAALVGALVTGLSSRMRHKSLAVSGLSVAATLAILYGVSRLSAMDESVGPEMFRELSDTLLGVLGKIYPPAVWLGMALVRGDWARSLGCAMLSLAVFALVAAGISYSFHKIIRSLYGSLARHDYEMGDMKEGSVLGALCSREFKRYFSSSVYVTNTIIGPVMGCIISGALLFVDLDSVIGKLPLPVNVCSLVPFLLAGVMCMMPTVCASVSMEGKNWWIVKSLPLSAKSILDAKLLMNLILIMPFYLLAEVLLLLALRPGGMERVWLLLVPAVLILFTCVYGLAVNLRFTVMDWESEVSVVKQSVSALLGGMGGFLLSFLCAAALFIVPEGYRDIFRAAFCGVLLLITALLYRRNCVKTNLRNIS